MSIGIEGDELERALARWDAYTSKAWENEIDPCMKSIDDKTLDAVLKSIGESNPIAPGVPRQAVMAQTVEWDNSDSAPLRWCTTCQKRTAREASDLCQQCAPCHPECVDGWCHHAYVREPGR